MHKLVTVLLVISAGVFVGAPVDARGPTFDERVKAQRAIEKVYWNHRIWPAAKPLPKPPLDAVVSNDELRAKVDDYLRKSNALESIWRRSINGDQLQAELDRMSRQTQDPQTLRELFSALNDDADLIAETLG